MFYGSKGGSTFNPYFFQSLERFRFRPKESKKATSETSFRKIS